MICAVNWNDLEDDIYKVFWDQNVRQFWVDEEIPVSEDSIFWNSGELTEAQKDSYEKILVGLTLLDTLQGGVGMPSIVEATEDLHARAIFSFQVMMEQMHAKSYSTIFSTLSSSNRIDELFKWVETNNYMQQKANIIKKYYMDIESDEDYYFALVASVMLETFLFYSGFFYPLWFAGQGKLIRSGEIISLIIRDESIHGVFTGLMAQKEFEKFDLKKQNHLQEKVINLVEELYDLEKKYTHEIYDHLGLYDSVLKYVEYNADKALMNIGYDPYFNVGEEDINPLVLNGINTQTKNHDFFSTKGNGYIKTTNVLEVDDSVFDI